MKTVRTLCISLILCILMIGLVACSNTPEKIEEDGKENQLEVSQEEYVLQLAHSSSEKVITHLVALKVKEVIEKNTNNKVKVQIYPNSQLGGDVELVESVKAGDVSMATMTTAPQVNLIKKLAVLDMPCVFPNTEIAIKALSEGQFRNRIEDEYDKAGLKLLRFFPVDFRQMSSNKEVRKVEDLKGIKIRTMENKYHVAFWKALGANPTPLAMSELYIALQQGTVDAQENMYDGIVSNKLHEQQKYIVNTNHILFINTIIMNKSQYESMPEDYKKAIIEAIENANEYTLELTNDSRKRSLEIFDKESIEVIELSEDEHKKIQEIAKPVYEMIREEIGNEMVDDLFESIEAAKQEE